MKTGREDDPATLLLSPHPLRGINDPDVEEIFRDKLELDEQAIYMRLTPEILKEYKEMFDIFTETSIGEDGKPTGEEKISNEEIGKVMVALGENPSDEKIAEIVLDIDYDGDGKVDFDEFTCLMVKTLADSDKAEEELVEVFNRFDFNEDGKLDENGEPVKKGEVNAKDLFKMFTKLGHDID